MALTRKMLKAMGIEDEKIDQIIDAHTETVDGLKADIEKYRTDAEKLPGVQKELETAQADLEAGKKDSWKVKYDAIKEEFEGYKSEQTKKETMAAKESAYRNLLKATGINEKRIESVLKVSDVDSLELDDKARLRTLPNSQTASKRSGQILSRPQRQRALNRTRLRRTTTENPIRRRTSGECLLRKSTKTGTASKRP